nr:hypothetical protein [Brevundimonas diminuta]
MVRADAVDYDGGEQHPDEAGDEKQLCRDFGVDDEAVIGRAR